MASAYICTKIGISTVHITETCATRFLSLNDKEKFRSISRVDVALEFFLRPHAVEKLAQFYCYICSLGVKVRNMKMDFNTRGTWHRSGNEHANDENL